MNIINVSECTTIKIIRKKGSRVELSIRSTHPIAGGGYGVILSNENVSDLICALQNKKRTHSRLTNGVTGQQEVGG